MPFMGFPLVESLHVFLRVEVLVPVFLDGLTRDLTTVNEHLTLGTLEGHTIGAMTRDIHDGASRKLTLHREIV